MGRQQSPGTVQMRKRAAFVDVGHQQAGRIRVQSDAHIDDVAAGQIDFSRRTCAFDDHYIVVGYQFVERSCNARPHMQAALAPRHACQRFVHMAEHDHLAVRVALGL